MGYTHYFDIKKENREKFKKASRLTKEIFDYTKENYSQYENIILCDGNGEGEPIFNDECVSFNGSMEKNEDYESCYLTWDRLGFNFTKTARRPYDIFVCLMCLVFKDVYGDEFEYNSDGLYKDDEGHYDGTWDDAFKIFAEWKNRFEKDKTDNGNENVSRKLLLIGQLADAIKFISVGDLSEAKRYIDYVQHLLNRDS